MTEWNEKDEKAFKADLRRKGYKKISAYKKPQTDLDEEDERELDENAKSLKRKTVVLKEDQMHVAYHAKAKPVVYTVKKGDTLKKIAEDCSISYGELVMHLLNSESTASIYAGQKIVIPRHFIDLSQA